MCQATHRELMEQYRFMQEQEARLSPDDKRRRDRHNFAVSMVAISSILVFTTIVAVAVCGGTMMLPSVIEAGWWIS